MTQAGLYHGLGRMCSTSMPILLPVEHGEDAKITKSHLTLPQMGSESATNVQTWSSRTAQPLVNPQTAAANTPAPIPDALRATPYSIKSKTNSKLRQKLFFYTSDGWGQVVREDTAQELTRLCVERAATVPAIQTEVEGEQEENRKLNEYIKKGEDRIAILKKGENKSGRRIE